MRVVKKEQMMLGEVDISDIQDGDNLDAKHISSLLKTYLYELKIKDEIDGYQTTANRNDDSLFVEITRNNNINSLLKIMI